MPPDLTSHSDLTMKMNGLNKNTENGIGIILRREETHVTTIGCRLDFFQGKQP
jgi:hypothetical protein